MISQPFKRTLYHATLKKGGGVQIRNCNPPTWPGSCIGYRAFKINNIKNKNSHFSENFIY